jgi:undecaprenyl-diphosphatase
MEFFILGVIQGLTEFLPISSSGHLYLGEVFFGLEPDLRLQLWLHFGSLLAVMIFFRKRIGQLLSSLVRARSHAEKQDRTQSFQLLFATLMTSLVAIFWVDYFENFLSIKSVGGTLIITAIMILMAEKIRPQKTVNFSWKIALGLGLIQGLTIIPGISRSGTTVAFLIAMGLPRRVAIEISFLLGIPTILGAIVFSLMDEQALQKFLSVEFLWGALAAFVASWIAIGWMLQWISRRWIYFSVYCGVVGVLIFIFS